MFRTDLSSSRLSFSIVLSILYLVDLYKVVDGVDEIEQTT